MPEEIPRRPADRRWTWPIAALSAAALVSGCSGGRIGLADRATERGSRLVDHESCGSCHVIPGKAAGIGLVGPPLGGIARRTILAGMLPNTPANLELWIRTPQAVVPGNTMPDMGLSRRQARDIAAYLYTLN